MILAAALVLAACAAVRPEGPGRGFPATAPWTTYYGSSKQLDIARTARAFRIIIVDADPGSNGMHATVITRLRANGTNRVLSYLNIGSVETFRSYWSHAPRGYVSAGRNRAAQLGTYAGYPDERWMNPGDAAWRRLLLDYVVPRLVAQGVDGFFFDNLELLTHDDPGETPWCPPACRTAGLHLVLTLRKRYPRLLFVMQGATGTTLRTARVDGVTFASLLDGVAHESVYTQTRRGEAVLRTDPEIVRNLSAWRKAALHPGGRPFFIGTLDYVGSCANRSALRTVVRRSRSDGFSPAVSDASAGQNVVCYGTAQGAR